MKPVSQSKFGPGVGDCLPAAVASLLELPLDGVPDFVNVDESRWGFWFQGWLRSQGYEWTIQEKAPLGWSIGYGPSPRSDVEKHVIVCKNGAMVHDPHPSGDGLLQIESWWVIESIDGV